MCGSTFFLLIRCLYFSTLHTIENSDVIYVKFFSGTLILSNFFVILGFDIENCALELMIESLLSLL